MIKVRVLVVDDNRRIVNLLKNALEKEEEVEVVGTASDGEEALQMIHLKRPDVVLLDLIMPKIDGLGVMERMQRPDFPVHPQVIVVSAVSQESVTEHAFALGAAYYILKPFDTRVIIARVKSVGMTGEKGDKVVIVSPSSKIDKQFLKGAKKRIESWGVKVVMGKHAGGSSGRYAGTISQRLKDLQDAMDDPKVKAILSSRGGYGAVHLIDKIDFTAFREYPKWLLGFSDITALHNLFQKNGYASLHSLMARHLAVEPEDDPCTNYLKDILFGNLPSYTCEKHKLNKQGSTQGVLRGGNMAVAYGLRGTPYDIPAEGTVLFIEDVSERPHAIERMMYNLKLGGVLEKLSGLIVGQFTEYEEDCSLGKELYAALADLVKEYDYPVCFNFPVGHVTHNLPLINGAKVEFTVGKKNVELKFIC